MKTELQEVLFHRYPKLFRKPGMRLLDPRIVSDAADRFQDDSAPFDQRGIECGDEWFAIVDRLSQACEAEIDTIISQGIAIESWPRIAQIKEKFETLRFYVRGHLSDELRSMILQASNETPQVERPHPN